MRKDPHYLRFAAAALFLALCAYFAAVLLKNADEPETVTAVSVTLGSSMTVTGRVRYDEVVLSAAPSDPAVGPGERVPAGAALGDGMTAPCAGFFAGDRLVTGGWDFVCCPDGLSGLYEGRYLTLRLGEGEYSAVVTRIESGTVTLRCREGLCSVIGTGEAAGELKLGSVSGVGIPRSALRHDADGDFVMLLRAGIPRRRAVTVLGETEESFVVDGIAAGSELLADSR